MTRPTTFGPWLAERRAASALESRPIRLSESTDWRLSLGRIDHRSGAFFSVVGVQSRSADAVLDGVEQPMILQPEIGILGFLVRRPRFDAEILVQAKAEPGNVADVQLAPTVQATESNYLRRHGGAPTAYLDWFTGAEPRGRILSDGLQSEQGSRFLGKYNRNVTVVVPGDGPDPASDAWRWVSARALLAALAEDFTINTDARSTLVCSDWHALAPDGRPFESHGEPDAFRDALRDSFLARDPIDSVLARLARMRRTFRIASELRPLDTLHGWTVENDGVRAGNGAGFDIIFFDVRCAGREVENWDQPLAASTAEADAVLLAQSRDGVLRFLLRGSPEVGFGEGLQFGPTAQTGLPMAGPTDLASFCLDDGGLWARADVRQSDEGGRFFRSVTRYRVLEAPEDARVPEDPLAIWLTLGQTYALTRLKGALTNEARSLLSLLLPRL